MTAHAFTVGQRIGSLTITQTKRGCAEQFRCDCGTTIPTWLEFTFLSPPEEIGWYHAPWLLAAETGLLRYDLDRYRIHGVCNNAADALSRGLLADAPGGPVLTELGAHMLAHWKDSPEGQEFCIRQAAQDEHAVEPRPISEKSAVPPLADEQLDLFGKASA